MVNQARTVGGAHGAAWAKNSPTLSKEKNETGQNLVVTKKKRNDGVRLKLLKKVLKKVVHLKMKVKLIKKKTKHNRVHQEETKIMMTMMMLNSSFM